MPIVAHNNLPSLARISQEGFDVISPERAKRQDIRELHIGFLNMMPDAAFIATERQFLRLATSATNIVQIYVHPIRCNGIIHNEEISNHLNEYYYDFETIKQQGLDAIIVTGANPKLDDITQESYWKAATEIFDWAENHVVSVFFSCLASHAVLQAQYGIHRTPLAEKLWGVYSHSVINKSHPLVNNINTRFDMPHSRLNDIDETRLMEKGFDVLATGKHSGVALAVSNDGFRQVFCQGHPEYDTTSILKEYKREISQFSTAQRDSYPPLPQGYINKETEEILTVFKEQFIAGKTTIEEFPEEIILRYLDNTWRDTAKAIFSNWLGLVYRITNVDRNKQFMDGIDSKQPIAQWYQK